MQRALYCVLTCVAFAPAVHAKVAIELETQPVVVQTDAYRARIEPDGCLTNVELSGINFLAPGVSISRGSYFYQAGVLKLEDVKQVDDRTVEASGEQASVRYEFEEKQLTVTVSNKSDADMVFFVVLNGIVGAGAVKDGAIEETAISGEHSSARFFVDKLQLTIDGFDQLWGPWQGPHQVVQTDLGPGETKQLTFATGETSEADRLRVLQLKARPPEADVTISSPRNYQVVQRDTETRGRVLISGRTQTQSTTMEVRLTGDKLPAELREWKAVPFSTETNKFSQWLTVPAGGWYGLQVRARDGSQVLAEATVEKFGVGEVFVGAGQSNSTNSGQFKIQQTSGMVSSFSGTHWQLADDPQTGVADRTQGGSFWPAFGDKMHAELGVPIGVATTGYGGTSVNQWQPDGDLFLRWTMRRIHQLGPQGFRAVLWHQGESDVNMPSDEYYAKLRNTILSSIEHAGWEFPWFVAHASYHNAENPRYETVRSAQQRLWDDGIAEQGPDTDVLGGDNRDFDGKGIHFSPKGLKAHGELWADKLLPYVRAQLDAAAEKSTELVK